MGLLSNIRKAAKKVVSPVSRVTEKILKPVVKPLRPVAAAVAPIASPFGIGLVTQPKTWGVKNPRSAKIFDRSQQGTRIAVAAAATYGAGTLLTAPTAATAAAAGSVGTEAMAAGPGGMAVMSQVLKPVNGLLDGRAAALDGGDPRYSADRMNGASLAPDMARAAGEGQEASFAGLSPMAWAGIVGVGLVFVLVLTRGRG